MIYIKQFSILALFFILLSLPFVIYTIIVRSIDKSKKLLLRYYIFLNINIIIVYSLFYLFILSIYHSEGVFGTFIFLLESFNVKIFIIGLAINGLILTAYIILKKFDGRIQLHFSKFPKKLLFSMFVFSCLVNASIEFTEMYGIIPIEQFLFHFAFKITGANFSMVHKFIVKTLFGAILMFIFFLYVVSIKISINGQSFQLRFNKKKKSVTVISVLLPIAGIIITALIIQVPQYIASLYKESSKFYEENYIYPDHVKYSFPEEKRNLIVIFAESLETGFLTPENGGAFAEDLIPEVTELSKNNISYFSKNTGIGGIIQLYGTEWTIAGIAACYLGVPLAVNFLNQTGWNNYGILGDIFLPGAYGIGDILHAGGYKNYFILGSDIKFGGRDRLFENHKDTIIYDYIYFRDNNYIPLNYKKWWGIEDRKLYKFAKLKIEEIAQQEDPFFITLLTADSHPVGGYIDEYADKVFNSKYKNVLRDMSKQLYDFVEWLMQQPFYHNTTVVILGDHLYQDSAFFPDNFQIQNLSSKYDKSYFSGKSEDDYNRYVINIFINSLLSEVENENRKLSHFDILPLLVDSIGISYNTKGLALGRSLNIKNSDSTLVEKYNIHFLNEELSRKSIVYNQLWGIY